MIAELLGDPPREHSALRYQQLVVSSAYVLAVPDATSSDCVCPTTHSIPRRKLASSGEVAIERDDEADTAPSSLVLDGDGLSVCRSVEESVVILTAVSRWCVGPQLPLPKLLLNSRPLGRSVGLACC